MKVKRLSSEQMQLLGKLVKRKVAKEKGAGEVVRDRVSLSKSKKSDEPYMAFIKPERLQSGSGVAELEKLGIKVESELTALGGYTAKVTPEATVKLEESGFKVFDNPSVQVVPDMPVEAMDGDAQSPTGAIDRQGDTFMKLNVAAPTIGVDAAHEMGYTGKGVGIAVIDTGVAPHPDVDLVAFKDFVNGKEGVENAYDDNGHGTHVAGDAASKGILSGGVYKGPAPDAHVVGLKVIDSSGGGNVMEVGENIVKAIDWTIKHKDEFNIRVINMSLGLPHVMPDFAPVSEASARAIKEGISVVVAGGNSGPGEGTINTEPGDCLDVITVGASDDHNTLTKSDDTVADFSSRGPTPKGHVKPDIIAPGTEIMSLNVPGSAIDQQAKQMQQIRDVISAAGPAQLKQIGMMLAGQGALPAEALNLPPEQLRKVLLGAVPGMPTDGNVEIGGTSGAAYIGMPGTSMASPMVAGVVADIIQANPNLSHKEIKDILMTTADKFKDVGPNTQGAGYIDVKEAIEKAISLKKK